MPEKRQPKTETNTAAPLIPPPAVDKGDPVQHVLKIILEEALAGNLTAAKLYLDFVHKHSPEDRETLTLEQVLELLQETEKPPT